MNDDRVVDNSDVLYGGAARTPAIPEPEVPRHLRPAPRLMPNANLILLRRLEPDEKTKGGIILPPGAMGCYFRAEVIRMGEGSWSYGRMIPPANCVVGDIVLVIDDEPEDPRRPGTARHHLLPVTDDDKQFVMCPGNYVFAIEMPPESQDEEPSVSGCNCTNCSESR